MTSVFEAINILGVVVLHLLALMIMSQLADRMVQPTVFPSVVPPPVVSDDQAVRARTVQDLEAELDALLGLQENGRLPVLTRRSDVRKVERPASRGLFEVEPGPAADPFDPRLRDVGRALWLGAALTLLMIIGARIVLA